jgi:hypothetical protein
LFVCWHDTHLIRKSQITTRLPVSEQAFLSGKEEDIGPTLDDAMSGASYSTFASAILVCHIFNLLSKHIHRPHPNDRAEDVDFGPFWTRHRDLDNTLSSLFIFLPEQYRLPKNVGSPVAVHTNMNLHASVIALHTCALDKLEKHNLSESMREGCRTRMLTSAREVVNIMRLSSHQSHAYRSPLVALALYGAGCVFIHQYKDGPGPDPTHVENLEFVVKCMEAIAREHIITRSFLQQIVQDIDSNGVPVTMRLPFRDKATMAPVGACLPLLAMSPFLKYNNKQTSPLPGRLPLVNPTGTAFPANPWRSDGPTLADTGERVTLPYSIMGNGPDPATSGTSMTTNKRRRVATPEPTNDSSNNNSSSNSNNNNNNNMVGFEKLYRAVSSWMPPGGAHEFATDVEPAELVCSTTSSSTSASRLAEASLLSSSSSLSFVPNGTLSMRLPHRAHSSATSPGSGTSNTGNMSSNPSPPSIPATEGSGVGNLTTRSDMTPGTDVSAASVDDVFTTAMLSARLVEPGGLGGLDGLSQFGEFQGQLGGWDLDDPENLFLQVQSALRQEL